MHAVVRSLWGVAVTLVWAAIAHGAPVTLRYVWQDGDVARVRTRIEGMGVVREAGVEQRMTMWADIVAREQTGRVGPGGGATLTSVWESATFNINGEKATLAPKVARLEKSVGRFGEVYWARERGRDRAARQGAGSFTIDTRQLAILDFLAEQVQYLQLPGHSVELHEKWRDMDRVEEADIRAYMSKVSEIVAVGEGAADGTCTIHSSLNAPLEIVLGREELYFRGKVTGDITHNFDFKRGRVNSAAGSLSLELNATWPGAPPPPAPLDTSRAPGDEAPFARDDEGTTPFLLKMQFEIRVERDYGEPRG